MRYQSIYATPQTNQIQMKLPPLLNLQAQLTSLHLNGSRIGIAFDVDGVVLRGRELLGGSRRALRRLYDDSGTLKIPFLFLTNGGGVPESRRAVELSELLDLNILPSQVVQGHSSFRKLLGRYQNEFIVATGKGEPYLVMREYGFNKVLSLDDYASYFQEIDPLSRYKKWPTSSTINGPPTPDFNVSTEQVKATFVISDPVDWGRDIQVLCDILRCGGLPGQKGGDQPPLYFAADDLEYQAAFPVERLGSGAFRIALESIFNRIHHTPLKYTTFGKPKPVIFKNAETVLRQLHLACDMDQDQPLNADELPYFKALYMIGDNPCVDIKGARQHSGWTSLALSFDPNRSVSRCRKSRRVSCRSGCG